MSRRRTVAAVAGIALVATGCYGPFSLDANRSADVAWVVPTSTGDPAADVVQLWQPGNPTPVQQGAAGDTAWWLAGDLDGNGRTDLLTAGADGTWDGGGASLAFPPSADPGSGSIAPFALQLDADKATELAWYYDGNGTWEVQDRGIVTFGVPGDDVGRPDHDVPVPGDYSGDGIDELAVYRPTTGEWWVEGAADPLFGSRSLGIGFPAPADYDGDGADDPAVLHLLTGELRIDGLPSVTLDSDAVPAPADYDGDGTADPATVRTDPTTGERVLRIDGLGEHRWPSTDVLGGPHPWTVRPGTLGRFEDLLSLSSTPLRTAGRGNHLGTGRLGTSATASSPYFPENMTLSINGYCTDKNQGDRFAARYVGTEACAGSLNTEHRVPNHTYEVVLPEGRTYDTDVLVFDGAYIPAGRNDGDTALEAGELPLPATFAADFNPYTSGPVGTPMTTTFVLHAADATPDDPTDDVTAEVAGICAASGAGATGTKAFAPGPETANLATTAIAAETNTTFAPTHEGAAFTNAPVGWWNLCRIPASAPAGRYRLTVDANLPSPQTRGSNNFALVANRVGSTGLCLVADDPTCPTIVGAPDLSIRGNSTASVAQLGLVQLGAQTHGRTLRIELWDPAEGGAALRVLRPTGPGTWAYATLDWRSSNAAGQAGVWSVPVSSHNFNGQLLTIEVDIPAGWTPPSGNDWWKLEYQYSGGATVTDRTTISAALAGPPVG